MCIFKGHKNFTIVSTHERMHLYAGYNGLPNNYSPLEFVAPDYEKWPLFKNARLKTVSI